MNRLRRFLATQLLGVVCLLSSSAFAEPETLSWQDLLPKLDETLDLNDRVPWAERVRLDLNDKKIRIPGFIVPVDFDNRQIVTRFLLVPYFGACMHEPALRRTKLYMQNLNQVTRWELCGIHFG